MIGNEISKGYIICAECPHCKPQGIRKEGSCGAAI